MLRKILKEKNISIIKRQLKEIHAHDLATSFKDLTVAEKERFFRLISNEQLAEMVSYMDNEEALQILQEFDIKKQTELLELMEPDDAADIILELDDKDQEEILESLGEESEILELVKYDDDETGSIMTNLYITINPNDDVKKATKTLIKEAPNVESIQTLFVVNQVNDLLGIVKLKTLLKAKSPLTVLSIMEPTISVRANDKIEQTIQTIRNYSIFELPVLDKNDKLVGMITMDDALDAYQEEALEDFEKLAALPDTDPKDNAFKTAIHRLPWLIILLFFSIPIAWVTSQFEEILSLVAILIVFQPMILDSAGNVATQTLAVTLKALNDENVSIAKNSKREILTGLANGFFIGLFAAIMTFIMALINESLASNPVLMALVVGLALWIVVFLAPFVAIVVPLILKAFGFDPAVASGPFITTINDVASLVVYFGLAQILLGGI